MKQKIFPETNIYKKNKIPLLLLQIDLKKKLSHCVFSETFKKKNYKCISLLFFQNKQIYNEKKKKKWQRYLITFSAIKKKLHIYLFIFFPKKNRFIIKKKVGKNI